MKTIVEIECPNVDRMTAHNIRNALTYYFPHFSFTVTEIPPPQVGDWRNELANELENSLDEIIHEVSPAERYRIADIIRNWQPSTPVAPAVDIKEQECDVCAVEGDADCYYPVGNDCYCPVGNGRCANFKPAAPVAPAVDKVVESPKNGTYFEPLLDCPFCGKKAVINNEDCSVDCSGCTASTFAQDFVEQAIQQWNERQPAPCPSCEKKLREKIEMLNDKLAEALGE